MLLKLTFCMILGLVASITTTQKRYLTNGLGNLTLTPAQMNETLDTAIVFMFPARLSDIFQTNTR